MWGHILQQFGRWFYVLSSVYNCLFNSFHSIKYTTRRDSCYSLSICHKPCRIAASLFVLLLLLNLIEIGHVQVWALTVTQMAAERLWSHSSKSSLQLWYTLKPEHGAATSLQQLLPASFSFTAQGLFYASSSFSHPDFSSSLPFFPGAGKSTGGKWPAPAADTQLSLALQVPSGPSSRHRWGGHWATALAPAAAAALQACWEVLQLNTRGQIQGARQGEKIEK